jgi:pilus assembly protein FimV
LAINKNKITAQAQKFAAKKQFPKAIAEYQKLLKEDPSDIRSWLKIGDIYTRMGSRTEATETYLKVAEQYTKNGFHLKAIAVYKQILKLDPAMLNIHQYLASAYLNLGLTSEALIQLEQLADMYERTNRSEKLLEVLLQMGEIDPANIATRLRVAEHLSKEKRNEDAVEHFEIACQELKKQGRVEDFLKVTDRLLYHDPSRTDLAQEAASIHLENNQHKQALAKLQPCFVADPRDLNTLELLTVAFRGLGQPEKAISVYKEMSLILKDNGQSEKHRQVLESILELDPKNNIALKELGRKPDSKPAAASPAAAPSREDALPSPAIAVADDSLVTNNTPAAANTAAPQTEPDELGGEEIEKKARDILSEATVLIKYGLNDRAIAHLEQIFEFDPYNIDARERLKEVLLETGDQDGALEQLFILCEAFRDSQPEGSVYYLHEILQIDKTNQRARQMIGDLGGIMPEDMEPQSDDTAEQDQDIVLEEKEVTTNVARAVEESTIEDVENLFVLDDEDDEEFVLEDDPLTLDDALDTGKHAIVPPGRSEAPAADSGALAVDEFIDSASSDIDPGESKNSWVDVMSPSDIKPDEPGASSFDELDNLEPAISDDSLDIADVSSIMPDHDDQVQDTAAASSLSKPPEPEYDEEALEEIEEGLDEVQFYLDQGIVGEAQGILNDLVSSFPNHPQIIEVAAKLKTLAESAAAGKAVTTAAPIDEADISIDDLNLSDDELDSALPEDAPAQTGQGEKSPKVALQEKISDGDFSTHYDLGIAYKDMGLFDNAIDEFNIASGDPEKIALAKMMIGMCYVNLNRMDDAVAIYQEGLAVKNLDRQQELGLLYELGVTYQTMDKKTEALDCFNKVIDYDPKFADVNSRIDALKSGKSESSKQSLFS